MRTIKAPDLNQMLDRDKNVLLINVLSHEDYAKAHIPGSVNVPLKSPNFMDAVKRLAGGTNRNIVVYCASKACTASPQAAKTLVDAGFTDVSDFEGGMAEWKAAGYQVESKVPAGATR